MNKPTIHEAIQHIQDNLQDATDRDDASVAIRDILVDLRHICDRHELDFGQLDERASELYRTET